MPPHSSHNPDLGFTDDGGATVTKPEPLQFVEPIALAGMPVPERRWMVRDWMPWRQTTALYGDGATGKSLLAQQLMTAAALGQPWVGLEVTPCRALAIFCEDDNDELHIRQDALNAQYGVDFGDLENARWISRVGKDNYLMAIGADGIGKLTTFWYQVEAAALDFGAQLLILDTAADMFGGNENIRPQVRQFVQQACTELARRIDGAVLLCAHPSAAGMASGSGGGASTAWNNSVRSRLYFERPKFDADDPAWSDKRILTRKKANYGALGEEIRLEWSAGAFRRSDGAGQGGTVEAIDVRVRERAAEEAFLAALRASNSEGRGVSASPAAPKAYAPRALRGRPETRGFTMKELIAAMERLFWSKRIESGVKIGTRSGRRPLFSLAETPVPPANDNGTAGGA